MNPELELLQPALEMAMIVARAGESAPIPIPAPRILKRYLSFNRFPPLALEAARTALEDDEFRSRVAQRCDVTEVGEAGWLFLTRPSDWESEFASLVARREQSVVAADERSAARALAAVEQRVEQLERQVREQARELDAAATRDAQAAAARASLADELDRARAAGAATQGERARAVRELKDTERRLQERTFELRTVESRLAELESSPSTPPGSVPDVAGVVDVDLDAIRRLVIAMKHDWRELGKRVIQIEAMLGDGPNADADASSGAASEGRGSARRRAVRLERGLVDGTAEAARWLFDRPNAQVFVDGYNVTMLAWPELQVSEQRAALERSITALQHGVAAQFVIVFDGDADGGAAVRSAIGSNVRVRFTPVEVEADDAILEMISSAPDVPVIVVSNDRRVITGAMERGANVVTSHTLVGLLRQR